ncbi:hypothetical protein G3M48_008188 [Beauveria asiatica]|uniref:C2H2-type domain-containing protein n=1 Tax=Beauveria asiatica TaxID=1069075 RepID=A0AAW0RLB3_9HYPO
MSTCGTCWRVFPAGWQSRQQHMDATGHCPPDFECDTCDKYFGSQQAVNQHMNDVGHWAESSESDAPDYECEDCDENFYDEEGLHDHEVKEHLYCAPCDRYFQNWNTPPQQETADFDALEHSAPAHVHAGSTLAPLTSRAPDTFLATDQLAMSKMQLDSTTNNPWNSALHVQPTGATNISQDSRVQQQQPMSSSAFQQDPWSRHDAVELDATSSS